MSKIPYKKCNQCGLYNDITVETCECGNNISTVPGLLVDEEIPFELTGEIDEDLEYYVQKCSACGALNFTTDPEKKVKVCYNCGKSRVYFVTPIPYVEEEEVEAAKPSMAVVEHFANQQAEEDDDDDDDDDSPWSGMLGNIKQATGQAKPSNNISYVNTEDDEDDDDEDDDDDDDGEVGGWASILGAKAETGTKPDKPVKAKVSEITLTAIRYGRCSHTFKSDAPGMPILLGRSAELADFLAQDGRVGNQHCYLTYKNGAWYVQDNHSANGTAVNQRDIGLNGERMLNNGDDLKLGHHPDSMEFRITIL